MLPKRWFAQRSAGKNASVTMIISRPIVKANEKRGTDSSNGVGYLGPGATTVVLRIWLRAWGSSARFSPVGITGAKVVLVTTGGYMTLTGRLRFNMA